MGLADAGGMISSAISRPIASAGVVAEGPLGGGVPLDDPALVVDGDDGVEGGLEDRRLAGLAPSSVPLGPAPPVTSRKTRTAPMTAPRSSRIGAALSSIGPLGAVPGDQDGVVGQADDRPLAERPGRRALDRPAGRLVDDPEDLLQRPAGGLGLRPAGQRLGDGVEEGDPALGVGGDHRVADAGQGHPEPLALAVQPLLGPLPLDPQRDLVGDRLHHLAASPSESAWRANIAMTPTSRSSTTSG